MKCSQGEDYILILCFHSKISTNVPHGDKTTCFIPYRSLMKHNKKFPDNIGVT